MATDTDTAHADAECGNRGHCDRLTGRCVCAVGFEGAACQRMGCQGTSDDGMPLACSGHGECLSLRDLARFEYDKWSQRFTYETPWDASRIYGCLCGEGYVGPACAERVCPSGDDPLTSGQTNEVQLLSCVGSHGDIVLRFAGAATKPISFGANAADVARAIEAIGIKAGDVAVTFTNPDARRLCYASGATDEEINIALIEFRTVFGTIPPLIYDEDHSTFAGSVETRSVATHGELAVLKASGNAYAYARPSGRPRLWRRG